MQLRKFLAWPVVTTNGKGILRLRRDCVPAALRMTAELGFSISCNVSS